MSEKQTLQIVHFRHKHDRYNKYLVFILLSSLLFQFHYSIFTFFLGISIVSLSFQQTVLFSISGCSFSEWHHLVGQLIISNRNNLIYQLETAWYRGHCQWCSWRGWHTRTHLYNIKDIQIFYTLSIMLYNLFDTISTINNLRVIINALLTF